MKQINFKMLLSGGYALLIDGKEIGVVYESNHAEQIEEASLAIPDLEDRIEELEEQKDELNYKIEEELQYKIECLEKENEELTQMNNKLLKNKSLSL